MFKPKQILVPTDFSPSSWKALEDASAIAQTYGAAVDVIHVWELPMMVRAEEVAPDAGLPLSVVDAVSQHAHKLMETFVKDARAKGFDIRNASVVAGEAYHTLVAAAESGKYDLIVIGSHGRKFLSRVLLGSVAERVVRHAPCPVLVAKARPEPSAAAQPGAAKPTGKA